jgi:ubiquinol-cytochrome c reductase cytochrome b subunit
MKNYSLFIIGIMMLVFAGMFHIFRHGKSMQKAPPPRPTIPPMPAKAKPPSLTQPRGQEAPQIAANTKVLGESTAAEKALAPSAKGSAPSSQSVQSVNKTESVSASSEQELVTDEKK